MKKLALLALALVGLSGCVAYVDDGPRPMHRHGHEYRHHERGWGDRDGDGVRDRNDRRPNNPRRY